MKAYFFCTFLGYDLYFFPQFFVLFLGDEPVATLRLIPNGKIQNPMTPIDFLASKFQASIVIDQSFLYLISECTLYFRTISGNVLDNHC